MRNITRLLNTNQFKEALELAEKEIYTAAYRHTGGNQSRAAKLLGVARGTLISKATRFGLK